MIEYNTDVSRTIISLISSGTAMRTPDIRYIMSHGGGTVTALTIPSCTTCGASTTIRPRQRIR
jgi:hypothetical protein